MQTQADLFHLYLEDEFLERIVEGINNKAQVFKFLQ